MSVEIVSAKTYFKRKRAKMDQQNYYSNPAFCQQSEYYPGPKSPQRALSPIRQHSQRALSPHRPQINVRQPPVGAQSTHSILDTSIHSIHDDPKDSSEGSYEEQEFYEEMLVDDTTGVVQQKKFLVVSTEQQTPRKLQPNQQSRPLPPQIMSGSRYGAVPTQEEALRNQKNRYEYVPMQDRPRQEAAIPPRVHRYAVIPSDERDEDLQLLQKTSGRYALVPVEELPIIDSR